MHRIRQNYCRTHVGPGTRPVHGLHRSDPRSACPRAESPKFPSFFLIFHQPKGCFLPDLRKVPNFTLKKYFQKTKRVQLYIYKKRVTLPVSNADPQKVDKVDFDFCQKNFDFCVRLLDGVRKFDRLIVQK